VENVRTGNGDFDIDEVWIGGGWLGGVGHATEEFADLFWGKVEAAAGVDVGNFGSGGAWGHVGDLAGFVVVGGDDLEGLDGEGFITVHGEHGDEDAGHDLDLGFVGCGDFDEDIAGVECDFGVAGVDDGGEGANSSVGVINDGIYRGVPDDMEVAAEVPVILFTLMLVRSSEIR